MIKLLSWHHCSIQYHSLQRKFGWWKEVDKFSVSKPFFIRSKAGSVFSLQNKCYLPTTHGCTIPFSWRTRGVWVDPRTDLFSLVFVYILSIPADTRQMFVEIRNVSSQEIQLLVMSACVDEYNCATTICHE